RLCCHPAGDRLHVPRPGGDARSVQPDEPEDPWDNLGHTSREDGLTITRDGGDSETVGTWQNASLRERREPSVFAITAYLHQVDNNVLSLYFGGGDTSEPGVFGVTDVTSTVEQALYVRH